jgi:hypothetical protein
MHTSQPKTCREQRIEQVTVRRARHNKRLWLISNRAYEDPLPVPPFHTQEAQARAGRGGDGWDHRRAISFKRQDESNSVAPLIVFLKPLLDPTRVTETALERDFRKQVSPTPQKPDANVVHSAGGRNVPSIPGEIERGIGPVAVLKGDRIPPL